MSVVAGTSDRAVHLVVNQGTEQIQGAALSRSC